MVQEIVVPVLYSDALGFGLITVGVLILYAAVRFVLGLIPGS